MASIIGAVTDPLLGTDLQGKKAADTALNAQGNATTQANNSLGFAWDEQGRQLAPWKNAGLSALTSLQDGSFMGKDPGYQFRLDEGNKAINAAASARGSANSGATLKALTKYGQDYASQEYNNAFNRTNQIAGYGKSASDQLAGYAGQLGTGQSNNLLGYGNAQASSAIAQSNRMSNDIGQALQGAALYASGGMSGLGGLGGGGGAPASPSVSTQVMPNNYGVSLGSGIDPKYASFSDERLKINITPVSKADLDEIKPILKAYAFNYKNDEHGEGNWIGIMAQDFEKTKLGKNVVFEDERGNKKIDLKKVLNLFLATLAEA